MVRSTVLLAISHRANERSLVLVITSPGNSVKFVDTPVTVVLAVEVVMLPDRVIDQVAFAVQLPVARLVAVKPSEKKVKAV
jgi:hypothetical protein